MSWVFSIDWRIIREKYKTILMAEALKELVSDVYFAKKIEKRIGVQTDTSMVDKELTNYESS